MCTGGGACSTHGGCRRGGGLELLHQFSFKKISVSVFGVGGGLVIHFPIYSVLLIILQKKKKKKKKKKKRERKKERKKETWYKIVCKVMHLFYIDFRY